MTALAATQALTAANFGTNLIKDKFPHPRGCGFFAFFVNKYVILLQKNANDDIIYFV